MSTLHQNRAAGDPEHPADTFAADLALRVEANKTRRGSILVVDDDRDHAEVLAEFLQMRGYQTAVAYDGATGLTEMLSGGHTLALVDVKMPVKNGFDLLAGALARGNDAILLMSGYHLADLLEYHTGRTTVIAHNVKELAEAVKASQRQPALIVDWRTDADIDSRAWLVDDVSVARFDTAMAQSGAADVADALLVNLDRPICQSVALAFASPSAALAAAVIVSARRHASPAYAPLNRDIDATGYIPKPLRASDLSYIDDLLVELLDES